MLLLACLLPSQVTVPLQLHATLPGTPQSGTAMAATMTISWLYGLFVVPLYAGYLQLVDAAKRQQAPRVPDIFRPYRQGDAWRLIGLGLANLVFCLVGLGLIVLATGSGIVHWYAQVLARQASHPLPPALPAGFWITMALCMLFGLWMMGFYAISLGQVALNRRSLAGAIADGAAGALKNVLPLLVFALSALLAWIVAFVVLVVVALLLALLARFVSPWLTVALAIPAYIVLLLLMLSVGFGVMYHLWRDVCGHDANIATPPLAA